MQQYPNIQQPGQMPPPAGMTQQPGINYQQPGVNYQQPYNPQNLPMTSQPMQGQPQNWMPIPQGITNCPAGLEYLTQIDQLLVKQKVEIMELLTNFETANKYEVKNSMGQTVYKAKEHSGCCNRQCCGPLRKFKMKIADNTGREVLQLDRPLNCRDCCFPCCLQEMTVSSPITGEVMGYIKQEWHFYLPKFSIQNAQGETVLKMTGPFCACSCCSDVEFPVTSTDGSKVGQLTKQWTGFVKEAFTDADNFGIKFPLDLDVKMKAVLLGAIFLIDFMYFEENPDSNRNHSQW